MLTKLVLDCLKTGVCPNFQCQPSNCVVNHNTFYGDLVLFDKNNNPTNIKNVYDKCVVTSSGCWIIYELTCGSIQKSRLFKNSRAYINFQLCLKFEPVASEDEDFSLCKYIICDKCINNKNYVKYLITIKEKKSTLFVDCFPRWCKFKDCDCMFEKEQCLKLMFTFNNIFTMDVSHVIKCYCSNCTYLGKHKKPKPLYNLSMQAYRRYKLQPKKLFKQYLLPKV